MDFEFQPWERLVEEISDGPPDGVGTVRLNGKQREFDFCIRAGRLFFRLDDQNGPEWNFLCFDEGARQNTLEEAKARLKGARKTGMLGRWFRLGKGDFGDGGDAIVLLSADGRAFYVPPPNQRHSDSSTPFQFHRWVFDFGPPNADFWQTPSSFWWPEVQKQWADADSSLRFSAKFSVLSAREQHLLRIGCERGTAQEMEKMLVAFLHAQDFWDGLDEVWLGLNPRLNPRALQPEEKPIFHGPQIHGFGEFSRVQSVVAGRITRFFGPYDAGFAPNATLVLRNLAQQTPFSLQIRAQAPSAHEKMEATFLMREILRENLDEKKVRLLLNKRT